MPSDDRLSLRPNLDCFDSEFLKMDFRQRVTKHNQNIRLFPCESRFPSQGMKMTYLCCGHSDFTILMTVVSILLVTKRADFSCLRKLLHFTYKLFI